MPIQARLDPHLMYMVGPVPLVNNRGRSVTIGKMPLSSSEDDVGH